ncbi:winged helix-turn-helix domain-containing protein [Enterococcus sp. AZ196]|uniref:winged helix-turn-helix domain-containing protein n=1 Tax=Enterococcus sp. AZ196 TaxID=2774659 RepID=UPI003D29A38F
MKILVLTKNVLAESDLQDKLQRLNQEVYCTRVALNQLLIKGDTRITVFFPMIIFSDTLLNDEVVKISSLFEDSRVILLRKTSKIDKSMDQGELNSFGIDGLINVDSSVAMLREELAAYQKKIPFYANDDLVSVDPSNADSYIDTELFMNYLSSKEKIVFQMLYAKRGECVFREEFYKEVWSEDQANSRVVHLSALIRKIRAKLKESNYVDYEIITEHGHGYKLA